MARKVAEARALEELEQAAATLLVGRSARDLLGVLGKFTRDGRLASVKPQKRPEALRALRGGR